tara:strand:- start:659 stop:955 length:297 start_codon:yes stop_codon:yes gene_type:complete
MNESSKLPTAIVKESIGKCYACAYDELVLNATVPSNTLTDNGNDLCIKHWDWCITNMSHYTKDDPNAELYLESKGYTDNLEWRTRWFSYYETNGRSPE